MIGQALLLFALLATFTTGALMAIPRVTGMSAAHDRWITAATVVAAALLTGLISQDPVVVGPAVIVAVLSIALVRPLGRGWARLGSAAFAGAAGSAGAYLAYVAVLTATSRLSVAGWFLSALLLLLEVAALGLTLTFVHELLDVLARPRVQVTVPALPARLPRVCIQVPAYNEPVELVKQTLDALAMIDYPRLMVQLVDNNTPDPQMWRPIEEHCRKLGRRFHFIHLEHWPGYKSGALNEATRRLPASVDIVAVVDADYVVEPGFLRETVGHFQDQRVAFVQTPQHYREWADDGYLTACFYAYKYFSDITMPSRNRRNSIIFCGTMGLIRRRVLDAIGGWDQWCITEDAEASLRILAEGWRGVYVDRPYGHGIMPLSFDGLKKQRFRWAFGGVQILKKHWRLMLTGRRPDGSRSELSAAQRYHYLVGGLQWFNEVLTVGFTALLLTSGLVVLFGHHLPMRQLTGAVLAIPVVFMVTSLARVTWAMRTRGGASIRQGLGAIGVLFSLSLVVAQAALTALVRKEGVFLRTPKARTDSTLGRTLAASQTESLLAVACLGVAVGVLVLHLSPVTGAIAVLMLLQGAVYSTAPFNALRAEGIRLTPLRRQFRSSPQNTGQRPRVARLARRARNTAVAVALAGVATSLIGVLAISPEGGAVFPAGGLVPPASEQIARAAGAKPRPSPSASPSGHQSPGAGQSAPAGATPSPVAGPSPAATATPAQTLTRPGATPSAAPTTAPTTAAASSRPTPATAPTPPVPTPHSHP
jgi:cellulose synthase/poly-beta-1,6-N-acetylglucosamine synthase-like glycosyltransferase